MSDTTNDLIRLLALKRVSELQNLWGDSIPEAELAKGFRVGDEVVLLKGPQGIFKPRQLSDGPLTISSTLGSHYEDELLDGANTLSYDYAPPQRNYDNVGLKALMAAKKPVILLKQVKPKPQPEYMVVAPMFVEGFDDRSRRFSLTTMAETIIHSESEGAIVVREIRRAYGEATVRTRLHQAHFRKEVLKVHRGRCCVCELRVRPLLQGAHIVPDSAAGGVPSVQNGLSLCSLHHAAYDRAILKVDPDYVVHISSEWLVAGDQFAEAALGAFDRQQLLLPGEPAHRPSRDFLAQRFRQ